MYMDVAFADGQYAPETPAGRRLLADFLDSNHAVIFCGSFEFGH